MHNKKTNVLVLEAYLLQLEEKCWKKKKHNIYTKICYSALSTSKLHWVNAILQYHIIYLIKFWVKIQKNRCTSGSLVGKSCQDQIPLILKQKVPVGDRSNNPISHNNW